MRSSLPSSVKVCVPKRAVFVQGRRKRAAETPEGGKKEVERILGKQREGRQEEQSGSRPVVEETERRGERNRNRGRAERISRSKRTHR